ncbi:hypothetical protein TgHK011_005206 [Trichoderma gracile]|nr:hypothetical protein TgHK011_005206 [Trichoderma gracile]
MPACSLMRGSSASQRAAACLDVIPSSHEALTEGQAKTLPLRRGLHRQHPTRLRTPLPRSGLYPPVGGA